LKEFLGKEMYGLVKDLFPICRSLTGDGVRDTLKYLKGLLPNLEIYGVPSGTKAFDWEVPNEWNIRSAFVENEDGVKVIDFTNHNLHVVGYSTPIDTWLNLSELQEHLYSLPEQPDAIPYVTSYYSKRWGFCLSHNERLKLKEGKYRAFVDSELKVGVLNYGELIIEGSSKEEILLSTYICHPSMANNELSGPAVTTGLAKWLIGQKSLKYTYRILFIPETIGSIVYLSKHLEHLKFHTIAGFNISCVGDNRDYSYLPSRIGNTISDFAALHTLKHITPDFKKYTFLDRGSDERQYCSPGVDLPIASIMRTKYGIYPEYHTSLDNLDFVSPEGLFGGYEAIRRSLEIIETNCIPKMLLPCEPQLGKYGLYPLISTKETKSIVSKMMDLIAYSDGKLTLLEISEIINVSFFDCYEIIETLVGKGLMEISEISLKKC
jgi:aminopeptidase-like protein